MSTMVMERQETDTAVGPMKAIVGERYGPGKPHADARIGQYSGLLCPSLVAGRLPPRVPERRPALEPLRDLADGHSIARRRRPRE